MKMLSTKKVSQRERIYNSILKKGYKGWPYRKFQIFFKALDSVDEPYSLENFCEKIDHF